MFYRKLIAILILIGIFFDLGSAFTLKLQCDGHIVRGATVNCTTWIVDSDNEPASGKFKYDWRDDAVPPHKRLVESGPNIDHWSITYNRDTNEPGYYTIRVVVCEWIMSLFCAPSTSIGITIELTDGLNGHLEIVQLNETRNLYVSTNGSFTNTVALQQPDKEYLMQAPTVLSYWFVDCVYYGLGTNLSFPFNFSNPEEEHTIETLVVGDFTPLPPPTTTPMPTTSTIPPSNGSTTITTTTTIKPTTTLKPTGTIKKVSKREVTTSMTNSSETQLNIKVWQNGVLVPYNNSFPYVCNSTVITTDFHKVYGYFQKSVTTKAPISNVSISGNNWLQHGELLSLQVNCKGSASMQFCYYFKAGLYNVTGNETCQQYSSLDVCDFPIQRYFQDQHTVIIIIKNDVSRKVTSVAVTVYKVKQQAQLSVIVVPVAFSIAAVIAIVFGVAYYIQNRSHFIVEVADFDFGPKYADMEYKTFKDRLKDSMVNAFTRDPIPSTSSEGPWPSGHKYGSMT
ncbi:uncharacterized protein [Euwallacea similis]|uniref:uncharacterized protein n=1 Tax=Euwallacea similis TaxID=1736056 RepID=UPI00344D1B8F